MSYFIKKVINQFLKKYCYISKGPSEKSVVYLTFDDGPELGITEFVLEELDKYGFKGTFFCRGDNAEKNQALLALLREKGHTVGNHTFSHLHAYDIPTEKYVTDVKRADKVLHTKLFRPPHGSLTFKTWWKLRDRKIVFWALNSEDSDKEKFSFEHAIVNLEINTRSGDIILFHFCHKHEKETRQILPVYLKWLSENGYKAEVIV